MTKTEAIKREFESLGGELSALPYSDIDVKATDVAKCVEYLLERFRNLIALSLREGFWGENWCGKQYSFLEIAGILEKPACHGREIRKRIRAATHHIVYSTGEPHEDDNLYAFIEDVGFSKRTLKKLAPYFLFVEQLTRWTKQDMRSLFGPAVLRDVETKLAEYGVKLKELAPANDPDLDDQFDNA